MSASILLLNPLEGAQKHASAPDSQIWLSASAGTGKTHVLTARVLRLLLNGAPPESILCLTFTKAGAAEMSERIQARLAAWVRMPEEKLQRELFALHEPGDQPAIRRARRLFARVLDAPGGGLRIQTIHAFCQTLLAGFPAEAGLAPGFQPLEGRAEAALRRATLGDMLVTAERGGDSGLIRDIERLSRRLGEEKAERYLSRCARAIEAMRTLGSREGIEARVRTALEVPLGDVEAFIAERVTDEAFDVVCLRRIASANRQWATARGNERADRIERWLAAPAAERTASLLDLHGAWAKKGGDLFSFGKGQAPQVDHYEPDCTVAHAQADALLALRRRAELAALLSAGLRAGQAYAAAYAKAKRAQGSVDFDDLIRLATALLKQPAIGQWIRYKLDRRTDHILVDEGQDTNLSQWEIVIALADEFYTEQSAAERPERTIFAVGDFKQAIFGFQGTDPLYFRWARGKFQQAVEESGRELQLLSLDRSFRSTGTVLAVVDRLIEQLGPDRLGLFDPAERHLTARGDLPGTVTLWKPVSQDLDALVDDEGEEGWIDDAARDFAKKLARQVRQWIDQPLWLAGRGRALRPEDVLILVRKRGDLASLIVARLHAEGVAVAGVDRLKLTAPLAVRDLMAAIRFVLQPEDDLNLAGLLVSPLFGLSQDELYSIGFGRRGSLWSALQGHKAADELRQLLARADLTSPYQFLETILSGPLDGRRKLMHRLGGEARDPIEELLNAALAFEGEATPTLQRFLDWFDRDEVEVTRDPSAPRDAVRVMTVHGAKGLQSPLVILADATGNPDAAPTNVIDWQIGEEPDALPVFRPRKAELAGSLAEALAKVEKREREEHWRLLYVAVTRAEEHLVIGGALGMRARGQVPPESWYAALDDALESLGAEEVADPIWHGARHFTDGTSQANLPEAQAPADADPAPPAWLHRPAPLESRPPRPLAPSSLGEDRVADPPPGPALLAAARRGRLLHALFERLPGVPPETRMGVGQRWLDHSAGVTDAAEREALVGDVCAIIADPAYAAIFAPDALAEAPIAAVLPDGLVVAGTVDRLLVEANRVLLVDFKTGRRAPPDLASVPEHHLRQMGAYAAALAMIFPGRTIEAMLLYTAGPIPIALSPAVLDAHKPGLGGAEQMLGLDG
ncbi:MAG TPA: double-strand break repair helicase AddA [Sphingomonas sp.]|uniref:double-strand break repair helicase AddA n=1 Tax=Sphingomonas sp. TaxID=28214 RepID=UPI002B90EDBB|nr:double-strand break repair helicase AddA [Sphingomonas sp.]HMI19335.1 double-strand break repair helicase AddA [Sphingomonas sp.]